MFTPFLHQELATKLGDAVSLILAPRLIRKCEFKESVRHERDNMTTVVLG